MRDGVVNVGDRIWAIQCIRDAIDDIQNHGSGCFFPDTSLCVNYGRLVDPAGCRSCLLLRYVPQKYRNDALPCFRIVLDGGRSLLELCFELDSRDLEEAVLRWLSDRASDLVPMATALGAGGSPSRISDLIRRGTRL